MRLAIDSLTYPFGDFGARADVPLDYANIRAVLNMIRSDLGY